MSSGIVDSGDTGVVLHVEDLPVLFGNGQKYEQINLFVFGHVLPDFVPLNVDVRLQTDHKVLRTTFFLPPASNSAYHSLFEEMSLDTRLDKMNRSCEARLRTSLEPAALYLDLPVDAEGQASDRPPLDMQELRRRFETLEIAATLVIGFLNNGRRHLSLLERAIEEGDNAEALRNVHALKGGAMNLGADFLSASMKHLENALKQKEVDVLPDLFIKASAQFEIVLKFHEAHKELFNG